MNHEICRAALVSNAPRGLGLRGGGAIKLVKQLREYVTVSRMAYLPQAKGRAAEFFSDLPTRERRSSRPETSTESAYLFTS